MLLSKSASLELQARLAGAIGDRLHTAVILESATIEHDRFNTGSLCPFADNLANHAGLVRLGLAFTKPGEHLDEAAAMVWPTVSSITWA
jgi:hypothetical protein